MDIIDIKAAREEREGKDVGTYISLITRYIFYTAHFLSLLELTRKFAMK